MRGYGCRCPARRAPVLGSGHHGQPAPGTSTWVVSTWPLPGVTILDSVMPRHSAAVMNSVVRSGPPNTQASSRLRDFRR